MDQLLLPHPSHAKAVVPPGAEGEAVARRAGPQFDVDRRIIVELESIHNYLMAIGHIDPAGPLRRRMPHPAHLPRRRVDADPRMLR